MSYLSDRSLLRGCGRCFFTRRLHYVLNPAWLGSSLVMVTLWNRADHYIFPLWFLLYFYLSFFPCLISAVADWMSAILPHMVWP